MADRTVSTHLRLGTSGFSSGTRTVLKDMDSLNRGLTKSTGFVAGFRKKLEDATKRLPEIEITADSSQAEIRLAQVRHELAKLSDTKFDVDADVTAAMLRMGELQRELAALDDGASFEVRAGIRDAMTDLALVQTEVRRLDEQRITIDVDTGALSKAAGLLGSQFESAIGVIGKAGPANLALLTGAIHALPTVAGVAAGGIVSALGGALLAVGLTSAASSERVKRAWSDTVSEIKAELAVAAQPLEGSAIRAANVTKRTFEQLKPSLARIWSGLVPDVDRFVDMAGKAVGSLGPTLEKLGDSFGGVLSELGDRMPAIVANLGDMLDTFSAMADEDPRMLADMVEDASKLLAAGAELLTWAGEIKAVFTAPSGPPILDKLFGDRMTLKEVKGELESLPAVLGELQAAGNSGAAAIRGMGGGADDAARKVLSLNDALEAFFNPAQGALEASLAWRRELSEANTALDKGNVSSMRRSEILSGLLGTLARNAEAEKSATGAIDKTTAAFDKNIGMLVQLAGKSGEGRAALDGLAQGFGYTVDRIGNATIVTDKFGNRVRVLPNGKVVTISAATSAADKALSGTKSKVDALHDKTITITVRTEQQEFGARASWQKKAQGGINRYAAGGIDYAAAAGMQLRPQPPGIVSKPTVLFGEGSSGRGASEAFIPYEGRFRKRAVDLLSQVADDFGLEVYSRNAATRMSDAGMTIDATGMQVSTGLDAAMGVITGALGEAGTLTSAIDQVGATGAALVTGWTTGAETLGDSVTAMGSTVGSTMVEFGAITADSFDLAAASTDALTVSVQELVGVIGSAAFAEASGSKGKAKSKSKSKAKPGAVGMTAEKADVPRKGKAGGAGMTATKADEPRNGKAGMVAGSEPGGFTEGSNAGDFVSSNASSLSMGAPVNSSRVSAPQQVPSSGYRPSGGGVPAAGGSGGGSGSGGGGPVVAMYGTTIRETVDADIVSAKIGMVLDSRG